MLEGWYFCDAGASFTFFRCVSFSGLAMSDMCFIFARHFISVMSYGSFVLGLNAYCLNSLFSA